MVNSEEDFRSSKAINGKCTLAGIEGYRARPIRTQTPSLSQICPVDARKRRRVSGHGKGGGTCSFEA